MSASLSSRGLLPTPTTSEWNGPGAPDGNRNDTLRARIAQLPTPRARDSKGKGYEDGLPSVVALLKTPTAQLAVNGGSQHPDKRKQGGHGPTLADEIEHLLPTPTAARYGRNQSASPGAAIRPSLESLAPTLLPTPRALDGAKGAVSRTAATARRVQEGKANLPEMVLSAFPVTLSNGGSTAPPSNGGKQSRADRHPGQLTIEAAWPPLSSNG